MALVTEALEDADVLVKVDRWTLAYGNGVGVPGPSADEAMLVRERDAASISSANTPLREARSRVKEPRPRGLECEDIVAT